MANEYQDSHCCGAIIFSDSRCSKCGEYSEGVKFEDADGESVKQYILPNGMLADTPYEPTLTAFAANVTVAVSEGCGDEECDCHQEAEAKRITPSPYCETGGKPTLSEIAVVAAVVMALFIFGLGLQVAEGAK